MLNKVSRDGQGPFPNLVIHYYLYLIEMMIISANFSSRIQFECRIIFAFDVWDTKIHMKCFSFHILNFSFDLERLFIESIQ